MQRPGLIVASCLLAATSIGAVAVSPASASPLDTLNCAGTSHTEFRPPISQTPRTLTRTIHENYGPCVGTGKGAGVVSGIHESRNRTHRSCLQLLTPGSVRWTIKWNTGARSTIKANRVSNVAGGVFTNTFTGTVTRGLYKGRTIVETMTTPATDIAFCTLGKGTVSDFYSVHTLTIV